MFHLAGFDQLGHRAHGLLDRSLGVDAMLVIQIDGFDIQSFEAGVAAVFDVLRVAPDAEEFTVGTADISELGREDDLGATVGDRLTDQRFVTPPASRYRWITRIDSTSSISFGS